MRSLIRMIGGLVLVTWSSLSFSQQLRLGKTPLELRKSAILELESNNQGLLLTRITDTLLINTLTPPDGMVIYYLPSAQLMVRSNGYWRSLADASTQAGFWKITGNSGTSATNFLGTTDDVPLTLKSNSSSLVEMGRRQTLGLTQAYTDYSDNDEQVIYLKSALQFYAPNAQLYKPKIFVDTYGNFRVKGSSAGTDYFEFGATGTDNDGGLEFLTGDDGNEPIVFKSYNYLSGTSEMMRLQSGNMAIGSSTFDASNPEKLLVDAGNTSSYNLIRGKGTINHYLRLSIQNLSAGSQASTGISATADNGSETEKFITMGINSSGFTNTTYPVIGGANTSYLYATGNDFVIGNGSSGKPLRLFTGGFSNTDERMRIDGTGNVGIGITAPAAMLDVAGTYKTGSKGTVQKNTISLEIATVATTSFPAAVLVVIGLAYTPAEVDVNLTIPAPNTPTSTRATVTVSLDRDLPAGVSIAWARLTSTSNVKVHLQNAGTSSQSLPANTKFYVTITEF